MLTVGVADRPEDLLDDLLARLSIPPDDPFAPEWISVPSLGFRTWLQLQLAQRLGASGRADGIVANIEFPFPGSLR
jgi:exodeoxyribonuclease V gamma subunit